MSGEREREQVGEDLSPGRFVKELWSIAPKDWICEFVTIQYRPTQENPDDKVVRFHFYTVDQVLKDWPSIDRSLQHQNRTEVRNIHPCVNPRFQRPRKRGKNSDVSHYCALWSDVDFRLNEEEVRRRFWETIKIFTDAGIPPSIIIESGHGLHAYWLLDKPYAVKDARPCCAGVQDTFQIADAQSDPSRVLRMPGTVNLKNPRNPAVCRIIQATWKRYPLEAFAGYSIDPPKSDEEKEDEKTDQAVRQTLPSKDPKIEEIKNGVPESGGPYGGRTNAATALAGHYCSKLRGKNLVLYAMHSWNKKNSPPLPDDEIDLIVTNIWNLEQVKKAERQAEKAEAREQKHPSGAVWFDEDGNFIPALMAQYVIKENGFLATPIGRDGRGIDLYVYENGVYKNFGAEFARTEVHKLLGAASRTSRINEVVELITEYVKIDYQDVNLHARKLINVKNGMLDWRTGELKPHDKKERSLIQINADYVKDATCPELDKFLDDVFPADCIALIEEFIGYLLIPDTSLQKAFVAIGVGGNGKGTFLKILKNFLGAENISSISIHQIEEDRFSVSNLFGKLANIYHDLDPRILESTGKFKSIVTGDPIGAEQKFKDQYTFEPYCRLLFSANEFPRSNDRTEAYFDRLIFVEFPKKFRGSSSEILEYDQVLASTKNFMPALLNRSISGLQRLMKNRRFSDSESSRRSVEEYRRECSNAYDFTREFCHHDQNGWIARKSLYEKYVGWCDDEGMKSMSAKNFAKALRDIGAKDVKREGIRGWSGIAWTEGTEKTRREQIAELGAPSEGKKLDF